MTTLYVTIVSSESQCRNFESIISFGTRLPTPGNLLGLSNRNDDLPETVFPPYGETFFHHPTGGSLDDRIIIDFIESEKKKALIIVFESM
ncbi:unnamed protein product [Arabidopsis lyrata]|nr:unnamed protein product [Arabidopsis lyrata]